MTNLTATQTEVVNHNDGAILVVAGPGSGKTRVVTERIRRLLNLEAEHFRVLALTFTNKAANEMSDRLLSIPNIKERAFIGTLHSFCTEVLANRGKHVGVDGLPNIFESYADRKQLLIQAIKEHPDLQQELDAIEDSRKRSSRIDDLLKSIGDFKNSLVLPEMVDNEGMSRLYASYNDQLRSSNALDYDDLLLLTYQLFEERPKIADFYRRQYRYICIDEAQDLNELQYRVLCSLCGPAYFNVMMVGDPKQAIFTWNGASPKYMDLFERDFTARKIELTENFRCSEAIVEAAKRLNSSYRVSGTLPIKGLCEVIPCEDEPSEADFVVSTLKSLVQKGHQDIEGNVGFERCAVIGRSRFAFSEIVTQFTQEKIPFHKKLSGGAVQSESELIALFELCLRIATNPMDRLHLGMLLKACGVEESIDEVYGTQDLRGITGSTLLKSIRDKANTAKRDVFDILEAMQWMENGFNLQSGFKKIEELASHFDSDKRESVLRDLIEWRRHWNAYVRSETGGGQSVGGFLSQVALGMTQQSKEEGVALLTVHSAKGMEFDVVFMIGMCEGVFPDYRAKTPSAIAEEQRNAFVAVTRSRRLLYATYPRQKQMPWGDLKRQTPSRFLTILSRQ